jgi:hypothetical protein
MNMNNLLQRLRMVRNAEFNPHAQRMCLIGYIGAMLELEKITWEEYSRITDLADNACHQRRLENQNAN